jgi:branched-chain amino acid transport system substrate-binding protein
MDEQVKTGSSKKWWVWGAVIVLIIIVLVSVNTSKVPEGGYMIGSVVSLTGNNAAYGQSTKNGMDMAVAEINKNKVVLRVVYEDDASLNEGIIKSFQKLISVDKVPVTVGFISSGGSMAAATLANNNKVVEISTLASTDDLKDAGDYVFRIREKASTHGKEMAKYVKNAGYNKIALYSGPANRTYSDAFRDEFINLGGTVIFDEQYTEKSNDYRSGLLRIKSVVPDVVYLAGTAVDLGQILVQAKEAGINTKWFASAGAENPKLIEVSKGNAEGLIFTTPAFNPEQSGGSVDKFTEAYKQKYGELPNFAAANGYDAVMLVYQVMKKYGYDAESIKKGLYATKDFPGVGGTFSFDEFGEVEKEIMFKIVKDGQFVKLEQ